VLTTLLDLLGVALLATFAWFVWAPLPLCVVGVAILAASWLKASPVKASE
jgi:hypothetical protein